MLNGALETGSLSTNLPELSLDSGDSSGRLVESDPVIFII